MSNETMRTPADVRELAVEIIRSLDLIARNYDSYEYGLPVMTHYDEMVDTVVALLRSEAQGEDTIPVSALRSEIALLRKHRLLPYLAWARLCALAGGEPVGEDNPAARLSDAQREEDDKPYAYIGVEETWDVDSRSVTVYERVLWDRDSATRWQAERPEDRTVTPVYHRPAACRGEAPGDGPVGAVCANCGAPNAAIAGGDLDPDEAVCSVECYEQLRELGCPQEHGGTYRPKPARRGEGGGE